MVEVPADYFVEMVRQALDGRIDGLCTAQHELKEDLKIGIQGLKQDFNNKIDDMKEELKEENRQLRISVKEFKDSCGTSMKGQGERIDQLEQYKYKLMAFGGAAATIAAFVFNYILKHFGG